MDDKNKNCGCSGVELDVIDVPMCGLSEPMPKDNFILIKPLGLEQDEVIYKVPVTFHVLWNTPEQNNFISDEFLMTQLRILNEDFRAMNPEQANIIPEYKNISADCKIEFVLDEIIRKQTNVAVFTSANHFDMYYPEKGGTAIKNSKKFCNIIYTNIDFAGGFSIFPNANTIGTAIDGNVIRIGSVQSRPANNAGFRIATHELGHWFGLPHTFQGFCDPNNDGIPDTPPIHSSSSGCPLTRLACDNVTIANVQNHMDYSDCRIMFTQGQKTRMRGILAGLRNELVTGNPVSNPTSIRFITPTQGQVIPIGSAYNIEMEPRDNDGIAKVDLYIKRDSGVEAKIATFTQAPYKIGITNAFTGLYTLRAVATDVNNETAEAVLSYTVGSVVNVPPVVVIQNPKPAQIIPANSSYLIQASATDSDGISKVEMFLKKDLDAEIKVASLTVAPYQHNVVNAAAGNYQLRVVATDSKSASAESKINYVVQGILPPVGKAIITIEAGGKKYKIEAPEIA